MQQYFIILFFCFPTLLFLFLSLPALNISIKLSSLIRYVIGTSNTKCIDTLNNYKKI